MITKLLQTFSKKDFFNFEKFVSSPYFSRGRDVTLLLKYLKKQHPVYSTEKLSLKQIHKNIHPGKKFSEAAIKMQLSTLSLMCREYLHINRYLQKKTENNLYLLEELHNRGVEPVFRNELNKLERYVESEKKIAFENINDRIRILTLKISRLGEKGDYTEITKLLSQAGEYLTVDFLVTLISNVQDIISFRNSYIMESNTGLSEDLIKTIDFKKFIENINQKKPIGYELVLFYYYRLMFYTSNGNYIFFEKAKEIAFNSPGKYSHNEIYGILTNLVNCCWWQIKIGKIQYRADLFEIYKFWINEGYLVKPGQYTDIQIFKNIFNLSLSLEETKWAENFLEKYSKGLNPEYSVDLVNYCYAFLYYTKKNYSKSLDKLKKTEYLNYIYKMDCHSLMLRIYFETGYPDSLFSLADSYIHYLKKHIIKNPVIGKRHLNFVKATVSLQKLILKHNDRKLESLKLSIEKENLITAKDWILQRIKILEANT